MPTLDHLLHLCRDETVTAVGAPEGDQYQGHPVRRTFEPVVWVDMRKDAK